MGRKRKYSSDESSSSELEIIKKKLKKLQKKIEKRENRRTRRRDARSSSYSDRSSKYGSDSFDRSASPHRERSCSPLSQISGSQETVHPPEIQTSEKKVDEEKSLSEDLINVIGKKVYEDKSWSDPIQPEVALRWEEIVKKGLPKEEKEKVFKKYLVPKNCPLSEPPKLNPEIKAIIPETVQNRDVRIVSKQTKITSGLSAIGKAMTLILEKFDSDKDMAILECLGDASSLLADLQHDESIIRRSLILANINPNLKETLSVTTMDNLLFSDKLDEVLKSAKSLAAVSKDLRPINTNKEKHQTKNFKTPPRQQKNYSAAQGGQKQNQSLKRPLQYQNRPSQYQNRSSQYQNRSSQHQNQKYARKEQQYPQQRHRQ